MYSGKLVRLRAVEPDDGTRYHGWLNDLEVTAGMTMRYPQSRRAETRWIEQHDEPSFGDAQFAIETLADATHIGGCGLFDTNAENRYAELGIMIGDRAYWDRGYGTDTVETLCRFGFDEMNLHRIQLLVHADNPRAQRVYERLGFEVEARAREAVYKRGRRVDAVIMSRLSEV